MMFFSENGFPMEEFVRRRIGPVIRRDELEYFREIRLLEEMRVTLMIAGLAEDGSRFLIRNEFWRADGTLSATVTSAGGWLDQNLRRLVAPPETLLAALRLLPRTNDFQQLPSTIKAATG